MVLGFKSLILKNMHIKDMWIWRHRQSYARRNTTVQVQGISASQNLSFPNSDGSIPSKTKY